MNMKTQEATMTSSIQLWHLRALLRTTVALGAATTFILVGLTQTTTAAPPDALIQAAKAEGKVVVDGPPIKRVREALTKGFKKRYGIPVSYISSGTSKSGSRVRAERAAGKYILDIFISGADTPLLTMHKAGWLDPVGPVLVDPDVTDKSKWSKGHLWYMDPDKTILRVLRYVSPQLIINTKLVKPGEVTKWSDLLNPKWKGKIVAKDPSISGSGASLISYFYKTFGASYVKNLYQTQTPFLTRSGRQMVQWLSQDKYAIGVGPSVSQFRRFKKKGFALDSVAPTDGPGIMSGGWGTISLLKNAPNPNAAKLFINWFASQEGQTIYSKVVTSLSLRKDVPHGWAPEFILPVKGKEYLDTYMHDFVVKERADAFKRVRKLLGL
jgi:iron(III) transport system substrate-binding protein